MSNWTSITATKHVRDIGQPRHGVHETPGAWCTITWRRRSGIHAHCLSVAMVTPPPPLVRNSAASLSSTSYFASVLVILICHLKSNKCWHLIKLWAQFKQYLSSWSKNIYSLHQKYPLWDGSNETDQTTNNFPPRDNRWTILRFVGARRSRESKPLPDSWSEWISIRGPFPVRNHSRATIQSIYDRKVERYSFPSLCRE